MNRDRSLSKKWIALSIVFTIAQSLSACGSQKKGRSDTPQAVLPAASQFFVHGDPRELLANTVPDASGLDASGNVTVYENYELTGLMQFSQRVDKAVVEEITSQAELEEENSTSTESRPRFANNYVFVKSGPYMQYRNVTPDAVSWPVFNFEYKDQRLLLKDVNGISVTPIHYSMKPDGEAFSILVSENDPSKGLVYTAIYFVQRKTDPEMKAVRRVEGPHNFFLTGDGVAIPWERDIVLNVCGKNADLYKSQVERAMADWSSAGGFQAGSIGRNRYRVETLVHSRPFSDLNQNCIFFPELYREEDQERLAVNGITIPTIDDSDQELISGTIFVFLSAASRTSTSTLAILRHELGHFLGLGHEFGTALKSALDSIMGYSGLDNLTKDDEQAIKNLYPLTMDTL